MLLCPQLEYAIRSEQRHPRESRPEREHKNKGTAIGTTLRLLTYNPWLVLASISPTVYSRIKKFPRCVRSLELYTAPSTSRIQTSVRPFALLLTWPNYLYSSSRQGSAIDRAGHALNVVEPVSKAAADGNTESGGD